MPKPELWATWNHATRCYHLGDWSSLDGEEWFDEEGQPVTAPEFTEAIVKIMGGPLDGDVLE
jgi:hypothetical protein